MTPIANPTKQAPLSATLIELQPVNRNFESRARAFLLNETQRLGTRNDALGSALADGNAGDERWTNEFCGSDHCEPYLACDQTLAKEVGISKRCCFCCAVFLKALRRGLTYTGSHWKVFAWAPPTSAPRDAKEVVLKELLVKLKDLIQLGTDDDGVGGHHDLEEVDEWEVDDPCTVPPPPV
ncbi:hypothetical protein FRB95_009402 [Tulasnella sp. JGI-2019a]|nr:hypothetical protein FRB95_009402 [Tulasnella sp. JGI-2019a]